MAHASRDTEMTEAHVTYLSHRDLTIDLNNAGCALLERRELLGGAMSVLRDALDALGRPPVVIGAGRTDEDALLEEYAQYRTKAWARAKEHLDAASVVLESSRPLMPQPPKRDERQSRHRDSLLYAQPLRLEPLVDNSQDSHGDLSLEETSAVVLFNLALAHHLAGERTGCTAYIDRAVQFYKMTETMVLKAARQPCPENNSSATQYLAIVIKGVLNNMGQICLSWRGDPQLGGEYFAKLRALFGMKSAGAA